MVKYQIVTAELHCELNRNVVKDEQDARKVFKFKIYYCDDEKKFY